MDGFVKPHAFKSLVNGIVEGEGDFSVFTSDHLTRVLDSSAWLASIVLGNIRLSLVSPGRAHINRMASRQGHMITKRWRSTIVSNPR
ncbi:hypothetical protein N7465_002729 [Penicillium sp. CMV-2018d]|nr:hypothetical protein N7465_002729 [Penicillium sp. CMV-2018d]